MNELSNKGAFIYFSKINSKLLTGIDKKVLSQVESFRKNGFYCKLVTCEASNSIKDKLTSRLPWGSGTSFWTYRKEEYEDVEWLYFRRPYYFSKSFIDSLIAYKKDHPNSRIIMEIPTYPYDAEIKSDGLKNMPYLFIDRYNRKKLYKVVDRVATLTGDKYIFGIPTIKIRNGIDLDKIEVRKPKMIHFENEINLGAVAIFGNAHAYERLLFGLREYYANSKHTRNVVLHLVGDGPDLKKYEKIVTDMNLEKVVKFHGMINSSKLDELYNGFDLGVASLGLHRIGVECGSFLKSREYLAKGLPMITASKIDILEGQQFTFVERFPADESNISIEKIIKFHDRIYHNNESNIDVINNIRKFANEHCGIDNMTKPVLDFLVNNSETNKLSY